MSTPESGWLSSPTLAGFVGSCADEREALLCALTCEAKVAVDDRPGCSALAGSGDGGGQGGFGGACLMVGEGNPVQDVERRTGW